MIDLRQLRQDPEGTRAALARRLDPAVDAILDDLLALDVRRRQVLARVESLKAERNKATEEVARRKRAGESADALMAELRASGDEVRVLDGELRDLESTLERHALGVPNLPLAGSPDGDASANAVVRSWGAPPAFAFTPKPHWELGERHGILDLPRGAKLSGSGFPVFLGMGARLVRALENFMLDLHTREHGYVEVVPPLLLNRASLQGTGQLPKFEEELYAAERDGLYLLPTAEVPVTNLHRDEILDGASLPLGYVACTPCFRREGQHAVRQAEPLQDRLRARCRVVEPGEDPGIEPADVQRVLLEVSGDEEPGAGRQPDEDGRQPDDRARRQPAERVATHGGPGDRSPDRARAPRESGWSHPPAGRSPAGR